MITLACLCCLAELTKKGGDTKMSHYVASSIIEMEDGPAYGEVAYGFDRVAGPFFRRFDGQGELTEDMDLSCHALAEKLQAMVDAEEIDPSSPLPQHIATLWLDLPI